MCILQFHGSHRCYILHIDEAHSETPMYSPLRVTSTFRRFPTRCAWCITPRTLISSTSHLKVEMAIAKLDWSFL